MRVYYFTNAKHGLDNINRKRLKISDFSNLNDPFELLGIEMSDKDVRRALQFEKSIIAKNKGLVCFSESKYDPVQWAHYADNHKGICLGFDVPDQRLKKIKYVSSRLAKSSLNENAKLEKILTTKFKHWKYEQEHRLIIDITKKEKENDLYFESFSKELVLKEIFIGCQSELNFTDIQAIYSSEENDVIIRHTRPAFKDFKIVWNRIKKSAHV